MKKPAPSTPKPRRLVFDEKAETAAQRQRLKARAEELKRQGVTSLPLKPVEPSAP
jgi:hypothetical protein